MNNRKSRRQRELEKVRRKLSVAVTVFAVIMLMAVLLLPEHIANREGGLTGEKESVQTANQQEENLETDSMATLEGQPETGDISTSEPGKPSEASLQQQVEEKLAEMTLDEKIGQMFVVTPEALTGVGTCTAAGSVTKEALAAYPVGGVVFFAKNIVNPSQITEMTENMQTYATEGNGLPLFLCIDEEGGQVARIASNSNFDVPKFSNMQTVGNSGDYAKAYEVGNAIGSYLNTYGFNVDFAPDADVLTNAENQVIGTRSFGSEGELVAQMSMEVVRGLSDNDVYGCIKHFPGHGATEGDTHEGYAYTNKTLEELWENELIPFQTGIEQGVSFIMVAHIACPSVTGNQTPASISETMVNDLLRQQMGYDGIVITDAMNMGAIANSYDSATAAQKAVMAGVDMILMPKDFKAAWDGLSEAVDTGTISEERIDESVRRILFVKLSMEQML